MKKSQRGFALILEMLVVVAIAAVMLAVSVPVFKTMQQSQNHRNAINAVKMVVAAQEQYAKTYGSVGFSSTLSNLTWSSTCATTASATAACLMPASFTAGATNGYVLTLTFISPTSYVVSANPTITSLGSKVFCGVPDSLLGGTVHSADIATVGNFTITSPSVCQGWYTESIVVSQ